MKKITLLLIALSLLSISASSQIKVVEQTKKEPIGKIAPLGSLVISLEKSGDSYIFTYRDLSMSPADIFHSFKFQETGNDLDNFYAAIVKGLDEMPKEGTRLDIPSGTIIVSYIKSMGVHSASIGYIDASGLNMGFSRGITKKEVNKLFGKK